MYGRKIGVAGSKNYKVKLNGSKKIFFFTKQKKI